MRNCKDTRTDITNAACKYSRSLHGVLQPEAHNHGLKKKLTLCSRCKTCRPPFLDDKVACIPRGVLAVRTRTCGRGGRGKRILTSLAGRSGVVPGATPVTISNKPNLSTWHPYSIIDVGFPMRGVLRLVTERNKDGQTDKKKVSPNSAI